MGIGNGLTVRGSVQGLGNIWFKGHGVQGLGIEGLGVYPGLGEPGTTRISGPSSTKFTI